jgi:large subunit ribosomal protein L23
MNDPYKIVHTVLVTEKSTEMADEQDKYCFRVNPRANKIQIQQAVEALFDVSVASVNVMNYRGKPKRMRRMQFGKRSDWKKAVVTLSEGSIDLI